MMQLKKERQAAAWCLELQSSQEMTEDRQVEFINWLQEDPLHEKLLNDSESCWVKLGELAEKDEMCDLINAVVSKKALPLAHSPIKLLWHFILTRPVKTTAVACTLVLSLILGLLNSSENSSNHNRYQTYTGEQQTYSLPDGSLMTLNTSSEVHVDFSSVERRIIMVDGEVLYEVAHDQNRPFIVVAGSGEVRALGTKFSVRQQHGEVVVALLEGKVEIETIALLKNNKNVEIQTLLPGEQVKYSPSGIDEQVKKVSTEKIAEWSKGRLDFTNTKLSDVILEVNRYTTTKLIIEDPSIQKEMISAYFNIKSTDSLLFGLKETYGIRYYLKSGRIYLYKPKQKSR